MLVCYTASFALAPKGWDECDIWRQIILTKGHADGPSVADPRRPYGVDLEQGDEVGENAADPESHPID